MSLIEVHQNEAGKCPRCGQLNDLTPENMGDVGFQDNMVYVDWICTHCYFEWSDWYEYQMSSYNDTVISDAEAN